MNINLPPSAFINKFIAKNKFYERVSLSTKLQNDFVKRIQRITWQYKLSEDTIGISKTANVTEIQIFEIELKEQVIPQNILKVIDRTIPYQILYIFTYKDNFAYGITLKDKTTVENYYFTDWNEDIEFDFTGVDLEKVYQKLIKAFIPDVAKQENDFDNIVALDSKIKSLEKELFSLENKIRKEKQFNRKVALNKSLLAKQNELQEIKKEKQ